MGYSQTEYYLYLCRLKKKFYGSEIFTKSAGDNVS